MAKKSAFQPSAHQDTHTEGQQRIAPELIASTHRKHPLHEVYARSVLNYYI